MVGQILPNNNESAIGIFPPKISDLNTANIQDIKETQCTPNSFIEQIIWKNLLMEL
jgi:hypothetical protein